MCFNMLIDHVFPEAARVKAALPARLVAEATSRNIPQEIIDAVLSILPPPIS